MKVSKKLVGRFVNVEWEDPKLETFHGAPVKGRAALAIWHERGVLIDVTEGVIIVEHSRCSMDNDLKRMCTWIPESLIRKLTIFKEEV